MLRCSWLPFDEAFSFERQHHLMDRRRADAKILLHVGFGRRAAVQARIVRASKHEEAQMNVRYRVELDQAERSDLAALLSGGKHAARKLKQAQILLAADAGASDEAIARSVGVGGSTDYRTKRRFVLGNLAAALSEEPRPGAAASSRAKRRRCWWRPPVRARPWVAPAGPWNCWLVNWSGSPHTSASRARPCAGAWPKTTSSPGARTCGAFRRSTANMSPAWRTCSTSMRKRPIPNVPSSASTRSPIQLIGEVRQPIPARSGQIERYDCEYRRNGTANLFVFLDVHRSWRKVKVTERRAAKDFAACMRELTDLHYPKAERIRVVLDNLSTHSAGAALSEPSGL